MNLIETLGVEIGVRQAGTPEAGRAAEAVADAFRDTGLEPRFHEFGLLGYEAEEPELEIDGERWDAGPCMYAHPTDGVVEAAYGTSGRPRPTRRSRRRTRSRSRTTRAVSSPGSR